MGTKGFGGGKHDAGAVGDDFVPAGTRRIGGGRGHQAIGTAAAVGADEEDAAGGVGRAAGMMIDVVFVMVFARSNKMEFAGGLIGAQKADFTGGVAIGDEEEIGAAAGAFDINAEALVFFLVEEGVGDAGAEDMAIEAVGALGNFVFDDIEESEIVGGPDGAGDALDAEGEEFVGLQILDFENELAETGVVRGIGEETIVVTDGEGAEAEEWMAFSEGIEIEEDFLVSRIGGVACGRGRFLGAAVDGVLLAFFGAGVIGVAAEKVGDAEVSLLNAAEHFLVEGFLEGLGGFQERVGEDVFFLDVGGDPGVVFVAEPGVMIHAAVAVDDVLDGFAEGDWGLRERAGIAFGQWGSRQGWGVV